MKRETRLLKAARTPLCLTLLVAAACAHSGPQEISGDLAQNPSPEILLRNRISNYWAFEFWVPVSSYVGIVDLTTEGEYYRLYPPNHRESSLFPRGVHRAVSSRDLKPNRFGVGNQSKFIYTLAPEQVDGAPDRAESMAVNSDRFQTGIRRRRPDAITGLRFIFAADSAITADELDLILDALPDDLAPSAVVEQISERLGETSGRVLWGGETASNGSMRLNRRVDCLIAESQELCKDRARQP